MPNFQPATITNDGLELMTKVNSGQGNIQFTRAAAGAGAYGPGEDMAALGGLKDPRQSFPFSRKAVENATTVVLRVVMTNEGLESGYAVREFGLFAQDPDKGEILYSIATAVNGQADTMPAYSGSNPVMMTVESYVTVSSAEKVEVEIAAGDYATMEDLEGLEAAVSEKAQKETQQTVTLPASGWTGSAAPYTNTIAVPGITPANEVTVLPQFSWTVEQAEAWAGAMILSGDQEADTLTLKAYGDKPPVDLPVTVLVGDEVTAADVQEGGE